MAPAVPSAPPPGMADLPPSDGGAAPQDPRIDREPANDANLTLHLPHRGLCSVPIALQRAALPLDRIARAKLSGNRLVSLEGIDALTHLVELDVRDNTIRDANALIDPLRTCHSLRVLFAARCGPWCARSAGSSVAALCFLELPALESVDSETNSAPLTESGWRTVRFLWRVAGIGPNEISEVDLDNCNVSGEEYAVILRALSHVPVRRLWLADNPGPRQLRSYRLCTIDALARSLVELDGVRVSANERANARRAMADMRTAAMDMLTRGLTDVEGAHAAWQALSKHSASISKSRHQQHGEEEEGDIEQAATASPHDCRRRSEMQERADAGSREGSIDAPHGGGGGVGQTRIAHSPSPQRKVPIHLVASEPLREEFRAMDADISDAGWALMQNARDPQRFMLYEEASLDAVSGRLSAKGEQLIHFAQNYALILSLDVPWPSLWANINGRDTANDEGFSWARLFTYVLPTLDIFGFRGDLAPMWPHQLAYAGALVALPLAFVLYRYPRARQPSSASPALSPASSNGAPSSPTESARELPRRTALTDRQLWQRRWDNWIGYTPTQLRKRIVLFAVTALYMPLSRCALQPFSPRSPFGPVIDATTGAVRASALWPTLCSVFFAPAVALGIPLFFAVLVRKATKEAEMAFDYHNMQEEVLALRNYIAARPSVHASAVPKFEPERATELVAIVEGGRRGKDDDEDDALSDSDDSSVISQLDGRRIGDTSENEARVASSKGEAGPDADAATSELLAALRERRTALQMLYAKAVREFVSPQAYLFQDYRRAWKYYKSLVMTFKLVCLIMTTNVVGAVPGQSGTATAVAASLTCVACLSSAAIAGFGWPFESTSENLCECAFTCANAFNSVCALALSVRGSFGGVPLTGVLVAVNIGSLLFAAGCAVVTPFLRYAAMRRNATIRSATIRSVGLES